MDRRQRDELEVIVGKGNVSNDRTTLNKYFAEPPAGTDLTVVTPVEHDALGYAAGMLYDNDVPIYTHRRGFLDPGVARSGGVLFDLSKMKTIVRIDEPNLLAFIHYGVTFERMKEELDKLNLRILMPAAATSSSVVRSYVDRDVILANGATRPYQLTIFHAILADGRIWMSGNDQLTPDGHSEFREDFGPMYSYLFHASEDIFGMPFAAKVWIYKRWEERRVTSYGFDDVESAIKAAYLASKNDQVFECVAADARYLSVLLTDNPADADALSGELPPWSVVFGFDNHAKMVDVWDRQTAGIASEQGGVKGPDELARRMEEKFEWPWYIRDRDHYRGSTETIDYFAFSGKAPGMFEKAAGGLSGYDLGRVAIPSYYGAAFYCETDIYCEKGDGSVHAKWLDTYKALLAEGAHVGRPCGEVAENVYGKIDPENIRMIKNLKSVLDPKGLLNRGQLIEGV